MKDILKTTLAAAIVWQVILYHKLNNFIWDVGLVVSWFIDNGLTPYKDFAAGPYFPLPKFITHLFLKLSNWHPFTTIVMGLLQVFLILTVLYWAGKKHLTSKAAALSIFYFSLWFGFILRQNTFDTNLFIGTFLLLSLFAFFKIIKNPNPKNVILFSFLSSIMLFSQQITIAPLVIILLLGLIYFKNKISKEKFIKLAVYFFAIFIIIPIGMLTWFWSRGGLEHFISDTILYYLDPNRYPFASLGHSPKDIKMLFVLYSPLWAFLFLFIFAREKTKKIFSQIKSITTITVLLSILATILTAVLHPRRFLYVLPLLAFIFGLDYLILSKIKKSRLKLISFAIFIPFIFYAITQIIPYYREVITKDRQYQIYNESHKGDNSFEAVEWIKKNTKSNQTIHVFAPMFLYYEAQRFPAHDLTYSALPWTYVPFEETKEKLKKPSNYWVVDERLFKRWESWGYKEEADYIQGYLEEKYQKVASFEWMSVYKFKI